MPKPKKTISRSKKSPAPAKKALSDKKHSEAYLSALNAVERMGKAKPGRGKLH